MAPPGKSKRPIGTHCNLYATLDAISLLPDEKIQAWGQAFDWSQPVERLTVPRKADQTATLETLAAVDALIDRQDARLNKLLLRPDMFRMIDFARDASYSRLLSEQDGSGYAHLYSDSALMVSAFDRALQWSDIETASTLGSWLSRPTHQGMLRWHLVQMTSHKTPSGLMLNRQPKALLARALDYCEQQLVADAKLFRRYDDKTKPALYEQGHLHAWRHWMCVQAIEFGATALTAMLLDRLEGSPSNAMFDAALKGLRFDTLASLVRLARKNGIQQEPAWPGGQYKSTTPPLSTPPSYPPLPAATTMTEKVVEAAMGASLPMEEKLRIASMAMSEQFCVSGPLAACEEFLPVHLAVVSGQWSDELLLNIESVSPAPSGKELFVLMGHAGDDTWNRRIASWQSLPDEDRIASLGAFLNQFDFNRLENHPHEWTGRLGRWLALLDVGQSSQIMGRCELGRFEQQVRAHEQTCRLDAESPAAQASSARRRM